MQQENKPISWTATLYIWWAIHWRITLGLAVLGAADHVITPLFNTNNLASDISYYYLYSLLYMFADWYITFRSFRMGLMDRYYAFTFDAQSKSTGLTIIDGSKKLDWHIILAVWWAYAWRVGIVPMAVLIGSIAAAAASHKNVFETINMLMSPQVKTFTAVIMVPVSIWVTREVLGINYRYFRFITTPKTSLA